MGKNWNAIRQTRNPHLRLALAQIPEDSEDGEGLKRGFPFCFTEHADTGPVPLSELVRVGWELDDGTGHPDLQAAAEKLNVPYVFYALREVCFEPDREGMLGLLSREWQDANPHEFGDIVTIDDYQYVVIDNIVNEELLLAPVQRVSVDTRDPMKKPTAA